MKKMLIIVTAIVLFASASPASLALSNEKGSDPTGKSQRSIIENTPWFDPTACVSTTNKTTTGLEGSVDANAISGESRDYPLRLPFIKDANKLATTIDDYIKEKKPNSPLNGLGEYFVQGGIRAGINPLLAVSGAQKETGFGTVGSGTSKGSNNSFGRTATNKQPNVIGGVRNDRLWYKWDNFQLSLYANKFPASGAASEPDDIFQYIARRYKNNLDNGLVTFYAGGQGLPAYAPASDGNDPIGYAKTTIEISNEIARRSDGAIDLTKLGTGGPSVGSATIPDNSTASDTSIKDSCSCLTKSGANSSGSAKNSSDTSTTTTDTGAGGGTWASFSPDPVAVEKYNAQLKERINKLAPYYKKAAENEGLKDWEILPAIHDLESSLAESNPTGNTSYAGIFQMNRSLLAKKGGDPTDALYNPGRKLTGEEVTRQAQDALRFFIIPSINGDKGSNLPLDELALIGIRYKSGSVYPGADLKTNAYVWAGFNTTNYKLPMPWGPNWGTLPGGGVVRDQAEGRTVNKPGFLTSIGLTKGGVFSESTGIEQSCVNNTGDGETGGLNNNIPDTALEEFKLRNGKLGIDGFPKYFVEGSWCVNFINYIFTKAGQSLPGNGISSVAALQGFLENNGEWHNKGRGYIPVPGDIIIYNEGKAPFPSHANIVVSVNGNVINTVGGNESNQVKNQDVTLDAEYITGYGKPK